MLAPIRVGALPCIELPAAAPASGDPFEQGRLMDRRDVLPVAVEQAQLLVLTPAHIGLEGQDADALLRHWRNLA